jgi:hypothetical protein
MKVFPLKSLEGKIFPISFLRKNCLVKSPFVTVHGVVCFSVVLKIQKFGLTPSNSLQFLRFASLRTSDESD